MTVSAQRAVLVGVDGSPASDAAVAWAARTAALRETRLVLVHVTPVPKEAVLTESRAVAERSVDVALQIETAELSGDVVPALVALSEDAELVVVGCRGLGRIPRRLLGSVSTGLAHHARCPVVIVHDEKRGAPEDVAKLPVVVGVDGSAASQAAAAVAFDEAARRDVELIVLHSWSENIGIELPGTEWEVMHPKAVAALDEWLADLQQQYPQVSVRKVVVPDGAARRLVKHSRDAQLVVVGRRGRGGLAGMLLGSVSAAVVEAAHTPVIVVRGS